MIKRLLILLLLILGADNSFGQTYGNEWINYNQQYYSFPITTTGIFRINYDDLAAASIPITSFSHENIQIFGRDKEVPLWIETNGDGTFDSGDYLLFYADKNDGWLDKSLYLDPSTMANPTYSLFNDTIHYFFTWNSSISNLRFEENTTTNYSSYTPKEYVWSKTEQGYNSSYLDGKRTHTILSSSFYVAGEGYGNTSIDGANGASINITALTPFPYQGAGAPDARFIGLTTTTASAQLSGGNNVNHHLRWLINGTNVFDETGFGCFQFKADLPFSTSLIANNTPLTWQIINDLGVATDNQALSYWSIDYPRVPNFGGLSSFDFTVENSAEAKIRIDFSNLAATTPIVFSFGSTPQKLTIQNDAGTLKMIADNSVGGSQRIVYRELSSATNISGFEPINGTGYFTNYTALNFEEALLMIYPKVLESSVNEYKTYRQSISGGAYNVQLANVEELYFQFGGGIKKHPNSIRRFSAFASSQATATPVGLFLLGKGVNNSLSRNNAGAYGANLLPTFGYPASDNGFTSNLSGTSQWVPLIPTGRITVKTDLELKNYLDKIIEYEQQQVQTSVYDSPNKDWQKHVIHLIGGGSDPNLQMGIQSQMNLMKNKIEQENFGGSVTTLQRESENPIDPATLNQIMERIENGVSLITYYGHYGIGANGFEINLDDVANWNNKGKYPLMIANSCFNGNIFSQASTSSSEYFVGAEDLGAIGYLSTVSEGIHPFVGYYSNALYAQLGNQSYGESIGKNIQQTITNLENLNDQYSEVTCSQMVLNGDPMIKVNYHNRPEIEFLDSYVSFSPNSIDLNTDSIEVQMVIKNLGRSIIDNYQIEIRRNFPGNDIDSLYFIQRSNLHYIDTIKKKFPLQPNIAIGLNSFDIKVDIPNVIPEQYDEVTNNQIVKSFFINIDGILPVVPYDFAVVPNDSVTIKASTIDPIAAFNTYRFQIDTTDLFNSPFLKNAVVSGLGGVKEVHPSQWDTPLVCEDSVVYFWRVAIDEPTPYWAERSFQYIEGKSGWGQDHFFQYKKNNFWNINYDRPTRTRLWDPDSIQLSAEIFSYSSYSNAWYLDGNMQDYDVCNAPVLVVGVVDPLTFESWGTNPAGQNPDHNFGNMLCRGRVEKYFLFRQYVASDLNAFQNMVLNEVPDGHHLLIYSPITTSYNDWNALDSIDMYQTFATLGATEIVPGLPNNPFIFYTRKGYPSTGIVEQIDVAGGETSASLSVYLYSSDVIGQETTPMIGPAFNWGNVYWKQDSLDAINNVDTTRLAILAYNEEKVFAFETNLLFTPNDSLINLNSIINASQYPYIRLKAYYKDTVNFTPAQIDRWHVLYDHVPEAAIDGTSMHTWTVSNDSLAEGEQISFAVDVKNIYDVDMDSLLIKYWIEDANHVRHYLNYPRQDSLLVGETLRDTIQFSTVGFAGDNIFWMEVNPYVNGSLIVKDQPEQEHFNNVLQLPFFVNGDNVNPILDVTFNGRHILNGDIVDPNSEIFITLKDENHYLIMDNDADTTLFGIYLTDPNGTQKRIPFMDGNGNVVMQWIPADAQNKRFKIVFPAGFSQDGKYKLLVQGADKSGNLSGDLQYSVTFEVVHASTITQMMNYPNPFSTSTRFVFTLTGSEVPDDIIIQIMTVSGRVVREITEDQLGPIFIGRNISEYAWDGTDEYGDPLANGVYLYNVRAKINGENIEHRESGADQYFKKNFGKMYLMR